MGKVGRALTHHYAFFLMQIDFLFPMVQKEQTKIMLTMVIVNMILVLLLLNFR